MLTSTTGFDLVFASALPNIIVTAKTNITATFNLFVMIPLKSFQRVALEFWLLLSEIIKAEPRTCGGKKTVRPA